MTKPMRVVIVFLTVIAAITPVRSEVLYLSNADAGSPGNYIVHAGIYLWQGFRTGPNAGGYNLDYVRMQVKEETAGGFGGVVLAADNGGNPGTILTGLPGPAPGTTMSVLEYAAGGTHLAPSTQYWIGMTGAGMGQHS